MLEMSTRSYESMDDIMKKVTILLFGQTGSGISSTANTILGMDEFKVSRSMRSSSETEIRSKCTRRYGRNIEVHVIPIPDLVSMDHKNKQLSMEILKTWSPVRPDAALFVIRADRRYTKEQHDVYKGMKSKLEDKMTDCFPKFFVVFTCGKMLDEEALRTTSKELCEVMEDASGKYVLLDNDATNADKERQVLQLLKYVDETLKFPSFAEEKYTSSFSIISRRIRSYVPAPICILIVFLLSWQWRKLKCFGKYIDMFGKLCTTFCFPSSSDFDDVW